MSYLCTCDKHFKTKVSFYKHILNCDVFIEANGKDHPKYKWAEAISDSLQSGKIPDNYKPSPRAKFLSPSEYLKIDPNCKTILDTENRKFALKKDREEKQEQNNIQEEKNIQEEVVIEDQIGDNQEEIIPVSEDNYKVIKLPGIREQIFQEKEMEYPLTGRKNMVGRLTKEEWEKHRKETKKLKSCECCYWFAPRPDKKKKGVCFRQYDSETKSYKETLSYNTCISQAMDMKNPKYHSRPQ